MSVTLNIRRKRVKSIKYLQAPLSANDNHETVYNLQIKNNHNYFANDVLVHNCDDPNNVSDCFSQIQLDNTLDWWTQVWSTRLNDKRNDCKIVVQQRMHEKDLSGFILGNDSENWVKLILPALYEESYKTRTIALSSTDGEIWEDPRSKEGQPLCPERLDAQELQNIKNILGESSFAGQYQQRPSPLEGNILKKDWFKKWKGHLPDIAFTIQSWDTAISDSPNACYSACTTWGVFYDNNNIANVILLSLWRGRVGYPELRDRAKRLYYDYRDTQDYNPQYLGKRIDVCLIESKATGDPLIRDLRKAGIMATPFNPQRYGNKERRVQSIAHYISGGLVWVPTRAPDYDRLLPFADEFIDACARFPNAESRDLVDTMTQAFARLRDSHFLQHPKDEKILDQNFSSKKVY